MIFCFQRFADAYGSLYQHIEHLADVTRIEPLEANFVGESIATSYLKSVNEKSEPFTQEAFDSLTAIFDRALAAAWDDENGGICYGFAPDGSVCDGDKYFWVQAESFAAAVLLAEATGEAQYKDWYQRIWEYSWEHMVDHKYGAWYRILTQDNQKFDDLKSPVGKTDYPKLVSIPMP